MKTEVHIVPFSHLDLFWAGTRVECLSRGSFIIARALDLLERYPAYRFMIESTNFLEYHLRCFPGDKERMGSLIGEGRLELIPMRSIIYTQLPSGETTIRNLLYGREYCRKVFGVTPTIMSMSDIPGVTPQIPQIAKLSGMEGLLLSRGCPEHTDFLHWTGLDGSAIPSYCPCLYASLVSMLSHDDYDEMLEGEEQFEKYVAGSECQQLMQWGTDLYAPSENIIKNIERWNSEGHRKLRYSTCKEFFKNAVPGTQKNFSGEIPSIWPNVESSWPDIWPLDIPCEDELFKAEFFGVLNLLSGNNDYPGQELRQAWDWLLDGMDHNQNGIGGEVSDRDKLGLKTAARSVAEQYVKKYSWCFAGRATSPRRNAFPIVVFNSLSWKRSGIISARTALYGDTQAKLLKAGDISLFAKSSGRMLFDKISIAVFEEQRCDYILTMKQTGRIFPAVINSIEILDDNAVCSRIRIEGITYDQPFIQTFTMAA
ncbi:MAG: hypothetical protein WAX69_16815 [Victivallales bacterium]